MRISFFRLETGGGWSLSPSTSPANHQKLNVIQKWAFHFFGWRGMVVGVRFHWPVWPTSEVECNTKISISFFWLERGGEWGLSPSTSLADHQKLNVIQKWAFHFIGWSRVMDGVWVHQPAWPIIQSERNPKVSISFYWLERGGRWGSSSSTSPADHQKWTQSKNEHFILLAGDGWWMGFESIDQPSWTSEVNIILKWAFHFIGWRGVADGLWVNWPAWLIIGSWM